eukprot:s714_g11.t2
MSTAAGHPIQACVEGPEELTQDEKELRRFFLANRDLSPEETDLLKTVSVWASQREGEVVPSTEEWKPKVYGSSVHRHMKFFSDFDSMEEVKLAKSRAEPEEKKPKAEPEPASSSKGPDNMTLSELDKRILELQQRLDAGLCPGVPRTERPSPEVNAEPIYVEAEPVEEKKPKVRGPYQCRRCGLEWEHSAQVPQNGVCCGQPVLEENFFDPDDAAEEAAGIVQKLVGFIESRGGIITEFKAGVNEEAEQVSKVIAEVLKKRLEEREGDDWFDPDMMTDADGDEMDEDDEEDEDQANQQDLAEAGSDTSSTRTGPASVDLVDEMPQISRDEIPEKYLKEIEEVLGQQWTSYLQSSLDFENISVSGSAEAPQG